MLWYVGAGGLYGEGPFVDLKIDGVCVVISFVDL